MMMRCLLGVAAAALAADALTLPTRSVAKQVAAACAAAACACAPVAALADGQTATFKLPPIDAKDATRCAFRSSVRAPVRCPGTPH